MRMSVRKSNNPIQPIGIFQNRIDRSSMNFQEFDFKQWILKTFIKLTICFFIFLLILLVKNINSRPTNYLIDQVEYRLNQEFKVGENYEKAKGALVRLTKQGEKALAVINIGNFSELQFTLPMEGRVITYFEDIIEETNRTSRGIIIEGETGGDILATQEGVIIETGFNQSSGNYIVLKHKGELLSVYKNIEKSMVEKNQKVVTGEVIGTSSGKLQFEVWNNKEPVDPLVYINLEFKSM